VQMQPAVVAEPPRRRANFARAVQVPLFQERPAPNVIPFESYVPVEPKQRQRPAPGTRAPRRPPRPRVPEEQGSLDFLPPAPPKPRTLGTTVEAVIFCDSPVAGRLHRVVAAAWDWTMVLIAYGMFLGAYRLLGCDFAVSRNGTLMLAAVLPLFGLLYGLV